MARSAILCFLVALCLSLLAHTGDASYSLNPSSTNITFTPGRKSLTAPLTVYIIWYGVWPDADKAIVTDFVKGLNTSAFWKLETMYYTANDTNPADRKYISSSVTLGPTVHDNYSMGKSVDARQHYDIGRIVYNHISQGLLPANLDGGVYMVLLDEHVHEGDYCGGAYCGFHTSIQSDFLEASQNNRTVVGVPPDFPDYAYGWVQNPKACGRIKGMIGCGWHNALVSPNGNPGVDSMLSVIAHEIAESAVNPDDARGWNTTDDNENADQCVFVYGAYTKEDPSGFWYNAQWGGRKYLMQQMWNPTKQLCGPALSPEISDCSKLQSLIPDYYLGDDCCNSGFADCANEEIRKLELNALNLTGDLPTYLTKIATYFPNIEVLSLSYNFFTGALNDEICKMKKLKLISVAGMSTFTGTIPTCIGDLKSLYVLSFHGNRGISGPIPTSLTTLPQLEFLSLGGCNLNGTIPDFSKVPNLAYFVASDNPNLKGSLCSGFPAIDAQTSATPGGYDGPIRACDLSGTNICIPNGHQGPTCFVDKTC